MLIFAIDIDGIIIKNKLLNIFPSAAKKVKVNHLIKRCSLRCFEILEFFLIKFGLKYEINEKLVSYLNSAKDDGNTLIWIITDRSRFGIKNVLKFFKTLRYDYLQIRGALPSILNRFVLTGEYLENPNYAPVYESPYVKPQKEVLMNLMSINSFTIVIDDDRNFLKIAREKGFKIFPSEDLYINDDETFVYLLQKKSAPA